MYFNVSKYAAIITVALFTFTEICKALAKAIVGRFLGILTYSNFVDFAIITTAITFLARGYSNEAGEGPHILGWSLFFAWMDLTLLLAHNRRFGLTIYMALDMMTSMLWSLVIFVPSFAAFTYGCHLATGQKGHAKGHCTQNIAICNPCQFRSCFQLCLKKATLTL